MGDVKVVITLDAEGKVKVIQDFDKAIEGLVPSTERAHSSFGKLWQQFAIGQIAVSALHKGWRLLKDQVVDSVKAAMDAENANRALDAALEITGRGAADIGDDLKKYAESLMKTTVYDDEAIKGAETLLAQLTNLDKQGIQQATRGAIGLASVFKMDLESAATLVAKAMTGNAAALSRYGLKVDETLPPQEKQAAMLALLEKMFGRATAETETFGGKLTQLKVRWGEVQEAAGGFITQQRGVIDILDKASQAILDYLTMGQMLEDASRRQEEQENRRADWLGKAAAAAGWQYQQMAKLIEAYGGITPKLLADINAEKYGIEIKLQYQRVIREEREAWIKLEAARKATESGTTSFGDNTKKNIVLVLSQARIELDSYRLGMGNLRSELLKPMVVSIKIAMEGLDGGGRAGIIGMMADMANAPKQFTGQFKQSFAGWAKAASKVMDTVVAYTSQAFGQMDSIVSQSQRNREIAIENEYKTRLAAINANIKDEDEKQKAITALEAEFEIKRTSAKRAAAKQAKAIAMMEAIVNTADAITKALAQGGFLLGIPWAAIVGALGAIQIGMIAAQPIPLAKGGYFDKPTLMPGRDGRTYLGGEAGAEIMSPVPVMRQVVREEVRTIVESRAGGGLTINGGLHLHVPDTSEAGLQQAADRFLGILHRKMRLDTSWQGA